MTTATIPATPAAVGVLAVAEQELLAIVERAIVPTEPSGPRVLFTTILSGVAAGIVALLLISAFAYLRGGPTDRPRADG